MKPYKTSNRKATQKHIKPNKFKINKKQNVVTKKTNDDLIRLNKYIANSGVCSRREADEYIKAGLVTINGKVVTELGIKVHPNDDIRFNNERLRKERYIYIVMNKPKDYITTVDDPHAKKTVLDIIGKKIRERIYPVGRLDRNTTGVLLLTNDGELTQKLTHPSFNKKKVYHVFLNRKFNSTDLQKLAEGITLDDGFIRPDGISYVDESDKTQVGIEIHSGRNRIVRRMFEHLGYEIKKLDRVYFAGLTKKGLQRGEWRYLTPKEIAMLKMLSFE